MFKYGDIVIVSGGVGTKYFFNDVGRIIGITEGGSYLIEFNSRYDLHNGASTYDMWSKSHIHRPNINNYYWVNPNCINLYNIDKYSDYIQDWLEENKINEEYNFEKNTFEIGDKVVINDNSAFKLQGYRYRHIKPNNKMIGEITFIDNDYGSLLPYIVNWSDSSLNVYGYHDILLYDKNINKHSDFVQDWLEINEDIWGQTTEPGPKPDFEFYTDKNNDVISQMGFNTGNVVKGTREIVVNDIDFRSIDSPTKNKKRKVKNKNNPKYKDNLTRLIKFKEYVKENHRDITSNTMGFSSPPGNGMYTNPPGEVTAALFGTGDYIAGSITNIIQDPYFNFKDKKKRQKIKRKPKYKYHDPESDIQRKKS